MEKVGLFHVRRRQELLVAPNEATLRKVLDKHRVVIERVERQERVSRPSHDGSGEMDRVEKKSLTLFLVREGLDQDDIDAFCVNVLERGSPTRPSLWMPYISNVGPHESGRAEWVGLDDLFHKVQLGIPHHIAFLRADRSLRIDSMLFLKDRPVVFQEP